MTAAERYAKDVLSGKIISSNFIKQAAQRFLNFLDRDDIYYNIEQAEKVCTWFEKHLRHWEGEWRGKPFILEDWQKFILQQIFGLYKDDRRLIQKAYIQVGRKNAKTTLSSGISAYHLFADIEQSPQILVGANNEDQAKICTTCTAKLIQGSPDLNAHVKAGNIRIHAYKDRCTSIIYKPKDGMIIPMSKEVKTKDGFNPSMGIIDEYHEADSSALLDVIRSGQGSRLNPLLIVITTAGFKKDGPCYTQLRKVGVDILNGTKEDDSQLALIYEPDEEDDWTLEDTWKKANPNYGVSVYKHYMNGRLKEAINEGAQKEVEFKTKNVNTWTNASTVWIKDEIWAKCKGEPRKDLIFTSGLDMAFKRDWSAWVLVGKDIDGNFSVIPYFWIPEETVDDKYKNENSQIYDWIADGLVFTTPGNVTDHDAISQFILEKRNEYQIENVIADPAYCISVINQLNEAGLETVEVPQTASRLTQPTTLLYEIVMQQKLNHGNHPILRWMISNAVIKTYGSDLVKITKENDSGKIDGIDAMINGLIPHLLNEEKSEFFFDIW